MCVIDFVKLLIAVNKKVIWGNEYEVYLVLLQHKSSIHMCVCVRIKISESEKFRWLQIFIARGKCVKLHNYKHTLWLLVRD